MAFSISLLTIYLHVFCFALVSLTAPTETGSQGYEPGYRCGNGVFSERFLLETLKQRIHLRTKYDGPYLVGDLSKVPIPVSDVEMTQDPSYIIVNSENEIVTVISPNVVDSSVDNNERGNSNRYYNEGNAYRVIMRYQPSENFIKYRKCEEVPEIISISDSPGGFVCGPQKLEAVDTINAAYSARKMYRKNEASILMSINPLAYPRSCFIFCQHLKPYFDGSTKYILPITANGEFDADSPISIGLDDHFNVIGAIYRNSKGYKKCAPYFRPEIIGNGRRAGNIESYGCQTETIDASYILDRASDAWNMFKMKRNRPAKEFPKSYRGAFFPHLWEPLYYFPMSPRYGAQVPTFIVVTRFGDVAGVIQQSAKRFTLCESQSRTANPHHPYFLYEPKNALAGKHLGLMEW